MATPRIRVEPKIIKNSHCLGLAAALNKALPSAKGQFIARMDGDDVCLPNRFSQQVVFLNEHPEIGVLGGGAIEIDTVGHIIGEIYSREKHEDLIAHIYEENPFIHPSVMV